MKAPVTALLAAALAGCGGDYAYYHRDEDFAPGSMHRLELAVAPARACEAAGKALLGEGYVVVRTVPDDPLGLVGTKEFAGDDKRLGVLQIHATCSASAQGTTLFATAVESHFEVTATEHKTAVGVPIVSPLTVSKSTTTQGSAKISGATVSDRAFYGRFYAAVRRELGLEK